VTAPRRRQEPTWTSLVLAELRGRAEDFASPRMLQAATSGSDRQVMAALRHLRKFRAVDVVVEVDGTGWWFALPPEGDARTKKFDLRAPERRPRVYGRRAAKVKAK